MAIPLYGFMQGDTMGMVFIAHEYETVLDLAKKTQLSAKTRVAPKPRLEVWYRGKALDLNLSIGSVGFAPLDRFDVIQKE